MQVEWRLDVTDACFLRSENHMVFRKLVIMSLGVGGLVYSASMLSEAPVPAF